MPGIFYLECINAPSELPLVLKLATLISAQGGGDEVKVISELDSIGEIDGEPTLEGYAATGTTIESIPIDDRTIYRRLCNEAMQNETCMLVLTHNAISTKYLRKETLVERPFYNKENAFFLNRSESLHSLNKHLDDNQKILRAEDIRDFSHNFHVDCSDSEIRAIMSIRSIIASSVTPVTKRKEKLMAVDDPKPPVETPKIDYRTQILMSSTNPDGMAIEDLLDCLIRELQIKQSYINDDPSIVAEVVKKNNTQSLELLDRCRKLQSLNRNMLDALRTDQGPTGVARIGTKR